MKRFTALLLLPAAVAFAQLDDNTITVTASRQVTLQPDQIAFNVVVATTGLDGALSKVSGVGITAADLTRVYSNVGGATDWEFTLTAPLSQAGATATSLAQLQQQSLGTVTLGFQGTQVSQALQQSQGCAQTGLVADAQKQAQTLASAAGLTVGTVLAVSDGGGTSAYTPVVIANPLNGSLITVYNQTPVAAPTTCTAVVKFQLYSYH